MTKEKKDEKNKKQNKKDKINKYTELENKYKRALADYQNLLKRTAIEKQEFVKFANEQFLYEILPVYDNLKISLDHIDKEAKKSGLAEGIKYIIKQFNSVLTNLGVEEIKIKDKKFNPEIMEAVDGKGEKIKKQIKSGYKLKEKVIIPAKVILEN